MVTSVQAWLTVALSGLAPEVAARLRAEYLGHAQDMLEAGEPVGAVLGALGDPARLNAELRERYLTEFEAKVLTARSRAWSARAVQVPLLMGVLGALAVSVLNPAMGAWALLLPLLGLVGSGWLWWLARRLPPERLALRGSSALVFLNAVMLAAVQGVNSSRPELVLPLFVGAAALVFAWWEYGLNGRLHAKLGR
jgi:uncharacterized membrane protein